MLRKSLQRLSTVTTRTNHASQTSLQKRNFFWPFTRKPAKPKFDEAMLRFIACPLTKSPLRFDAETSELVNDEWGIRYPVKDGTPVLMLSEAKRVIPEGSQDTDEALDVDGIKAALELESNPLHQPASDEPTPHTWKPS